MTTTTYRKSPGLIDAEAELRRQPIERVLIWINERPAAVPIEACLPTIAAAVGHDVDPVDVGAALVAASLSHGSSNDILARVFADAVDELIDARLCGACRDVIGDGTSYLECGDVGEPFCTWECHRAYHAGGPCDAVSER